VVLYGKGLAIGIAKSQLWIYPLAGTQAPFRLLEGDSIETEGQFSPDGRWIAYASNESGRKEVYLVPFRDRSASLSGALVRERLQVSVAGGHAPRWRRDGKELFYLAADKMLNSVQVLSAGSQLHLGPARPLFHINPNLAGSYSYDVSPDAKRFIVNTAPEEKTAPITLVQNWQSDFK
jgi:dipeptidyl aminopeptidase/acylaminoacyl peptidase